MDIIKKLASNHKWNLPCSCPRCGAALSLSENHAHLTCTNDFCPSRTAGMVDKWCSVMGIKELGLTTIEKIQERGYFSSISAMYEEIDDPAGPIHAELSGLLGKNWENIVSEFNSHRRITLAKLVAGYNIPGIGEKQIQKVIDSFGVRTIDDLCADSNESRFTCNGIGFLISQKLHHGLELLADDMRKTAGHVELVEAGPVGGKLAGMSFCFTGAMEYKRKDLQEMVSSNGGKNSDTVTRDLTYLVMQDPDSTSGKAKKAREFGTKLITPEEFLAMIR